MLQFVCIQYLISKNEYEMEGLSMDYEKWMNRAKEIIEKEVEYNKRFE